MTNSHVPGKTRALARTFKTAALLAVILFLVLLPLTASAQTPEESAAPNLNIPIPNVQFSHALQDGGTLALPFIGEYISGVYMFLVSIVGVVAGVMILVGGYQYLTAGGDKTRVEQGRKRIVNALTGLVLVFGAYLILYTVNPDLVNFEALRIEGTRTETFETEDESGLVEATETTPSVSRPRRVCDSIASCRAICEKGRENWPDASPGMIEPSQTIVIKEMQGVTTAGTRRTTPQTAQLLARAGRTASQQGLTIHVTSAYRNLAGQLRIACRAIAGGEGEEKLGHTIAYPGGSFHGVGYAIDVQLWRGAPSGRCIPRNTDCLSMSGNSRAQQDERWREGARTLAEIMLSSGFRRLNNEVWHFEPASAPSAGCRCASMETCTFPPSVSCSGS